LGWSAGIVEQRRRVEVAGADNEGDLVFLLQIVELFGEIGKLVKRTDRICTK
jgi:hypothetical protein